MFSGPAKLCFRTRSQIDWEERKTNLGYSGLVSADRSNKATLPLTTPSITSKSSAKDLSSHMIILRFAGAAPEPFRSSTAASQYGPGDTHGARSICTHAMQYARVEIVRI